MTVSLLSWYHWSDSVWVEETRQRLRDRAEESRRKRQDLLFDDDEDISIIEEKSMHRGDDSEDIEELSGFSESEVRKRKIALGELEEPKS